MVNSEGKSETSITKSTNISIALAVLLAGAVFFAGKEYASAAIRFGYIEEKISQIFSKLDALENRLSQLERKRP